MISQYLSDLGALGDRLRDAGLPASSADRFVPLLEAARAERGGDAKAWLVSAPGRSELGGNHTDHNLGLAIACAINLDTIGVAIPRADPIIAMRSAGFPQIQVDLQSLTARENETGTTASLVRGVAAAFAERGHAIGGIDLFAASRVLVGSGLSSSASVEVLIATALNAIYNNAQIPPVQIASIGKRAENEYFGKPSGLLDQLSSAVGGIIGIDFADPDRPGVRRIDYSFAARDMALLIVDSGGSHADLTAEYAAVASEMRAVAGALGSQVLRGVSRDDLRRALPQLRGELGDRALLRALHYFGENERVEAMLSAIERDDLASYLASVAASGRSSYMLLQNAYPAAAPREQGVALALALGEEFFASHDLSNGVGAACRVHGGGFAGTVQFYLPRELVEEFRREMERVFGDGAVTELAVRGIGAVSVSP